MARRRPKRGRSGPLLAPLEDWCVLVNQGLKDGHTGSVTSYDPELGLARGCGSKERYRFPSGTVLDTNPRTLYLLEPPLRGRPVASCDRAGRARGSAGAAELRGEATSRPFPATRGDALHLPLGRRPCKAPFVDRLANATVGEPVP